MNLELRQRIAQLSPEKRAFLEQRVLKQKTRSAAASSIPRCDRQEPLPLSFAQQRLWFLDRLHPETSLYHIAKAYRLRGSLNQNALQQALDTVVARHEALRTRIVAPDGIPQQVIDGPQPVLLRTIDVQDHPQADRESVLDRVLRAESDRPFGLADDLMIRATLVSLAPDENVLLLVVHHVAIDGWSIPILLHELSVAYEAALQETRPSLPDLPLQYADYAVWQRNQLRGDRLNREVHYWRDQLADLSPVDLPTDHPRPTTQTFNADTHVFNLPSSVHPGVDALARNEKSTRFMVLFAALNAVLARYTGQTDIAIGSPIAGRPEEELADVIGFFVNTLVLRTDTSGDPSFRTLLRRVRDTALDAYAHEALPFDKLVEHLKPTREPGRTPFFQIMFALDRDDGRGLQLSGLNVESVKVKASAAKFDLTVSIRESEDGLDGTLTYNTALFEAETIDRMAGHFCTLLDAALAAPDQPLSTLPLLSETERQTLVNGWNDTTTAYPRTRSVPTIFEEQAELRPNLVALEHGDQILTYRELNRRANQLAHRLQEQGVTSGAPVGLLTERSVEGTICMLAILKAGGLYVPLDPSHPAPRLQFMLEDAEAVVLLTTVPLPNDFDAGALDVQPVDLSAWAFDEAPATNLPATTSAEDPAYAIYTSGSTGQPKGVLVPHRAIVRLVKNTDYVDLSPSDRMAHVSNVSFDAATFEIWGALLNGARMVIVDSDVALSPTRFADLLRDRQVSTLFLTTALFNTMARERPAAFAPLTSVLFGGEAVTPNWVRAVLMAGPPERLLHVYGPTENTTFSTWHRVNAVAENASTIPIGKPIANTTAYVLDDQMQPVPVGVPGELYLGGDGLALGYLNRPERTAETFVDHPFSDVPNARLYKTGDRVQWRADGTIEFLGRTDHQIKLRGFRIELGEIEAALTQHPAVEDSIAHVWTSETGEKHLVGYVIPRENDTISPDALRADLQTQLPPYMVPSCIEPVSALPLTPNGKVDRAALPAPTWDTSSQTQFVSPRTPQEAQLTKLWETVLKNDRIGVRDNFFDLGGHSLLAVELFAEIERLFDKNLRISTLFTAPTIEELATLLDEGEEGGWNALVPIQPNGTRPPLFCTHGHGSSVMHYAPLAQHLGADQPVYGLQGEGLDGRRITYTSVEEMARPYVDEIRSLQPTGPYLLTGFCFGGLVALEVAQQLQAQGQTVALVALVETVYPSDRGSRPILSSESDSAPKTPLDKLRTEGLGALVRRIKASLVHHWTFGKRALYRFLGKRYLAQNRTLPQRLRSVYINDVNFDVISAYRPAPYTGRVAVFRSASLQHSRPDLGWSEGVTGPIEVHSIEGPHDLLKGACVAPLAEAMDAHIAAVLNETRPREQSNGRYTPADVRPPVVPHVS